MSCLRKVARVVADHLAWFDAAEAWGMTWRNMAAMLSEIDRNGNPLSIGPLSPAVWRARMTQ